MRWMLHSNSLGDENKEPEIDTDKNQHVWGGSDANTIICTIILIYSTALK